MAVAFRLVFNCSLEYASIRRSLAPPTPSRAMIDGMLQNEPALRSAAFLAVFALVGAWEALAPCRSQRLARRTRWPHNLGLLALDVLLLRVFAPGAAIAVAVAAETHGWGLLGTT